MKKLKLKLEGMKEMLTKEQMKKVNGGYDYDYCYSGPSPCPYIVWACPDHYECLGGVAYICSDIMPSGPCFQD